MTDVIKHGSWNIGTPFALPRCCGSSRLVLRNLLFTDATPTVSKCALTPEFCAQPQKTGGCTLHTSCGLAQARRVAWPARTENGQARPPKLTEQTRPTWSARP
eukprot:6108898-Prymnesium_polylepis.2